MRTIPIEVYVSWPRANYTNPVQRGPAIYIVCAVSLIIMTFALGLRIWVRVFQRRWFGQDDVFILLAYVCLHMAALDAETGLP